jgi:hypothetical protein
MRRFSKDIFSFLCNEKTRRMWMPVAVIIHRRCVTGFIRLGEFPVTVKAGFEPDIRIKF